ncbi:MAG: hypothetical protein K2K85_02230 [Clostridia bacterium]|nr:hypothetical protein [Clostridia bacterium]
MISYNIDLNNFKINKEKDGTILCLDKNTNEIFYFNKTAELVFDNLAITDSKVLLDIFINKYPKVDRDILEKDVNELLYLMNNLGLLKITGDTDKQPFGVHFVGELDYDKVSAFIKASFKRKDFFAFGVVGYDSIYDKEAIRQRQFSNAEVFVVDYDENGEIRSCAIFGRSSYINILNLIGIFVPRNNSAETLNKMIAFVKKNIGKNLNKIRFSYFDYNKELITILDNVGFEKEAIFEKEFQGKDMYILRKFV